VWNVVVPGAVCLAVKCFDSKSVWEPMSYHTGNGHTACCLIQPCHGIQYQWRRNTTVACTYKVSAI